MVVETRERLARRIGELFTLHGEIRAVEYDDSWVTWADLGHLSQQLDVVLSEAGVGRGVMVGLLAHERPATVAAMLGLIVSGRAAALLSPAVPTAALVDHTVRDGLVGVVGDVDDWERTGLWDAIGERALAVQLSRSIGRVAGAPGPSLSAEDTILSVMTSGTTGPPKPVPMSSAFVARTVMSAPAGDPRTARGAVINALPLCSVGGALAVLGSVWRGRPLALLERFDVFQWAALLREHRPRRAGGPPAVLRMILDADIDIDTFATVEAFETGSAPLDPDLADEFETRYGLPVLSAYGATEFLAAVAGWTLQDHKKWWDRKRGSAGRPLGGARLRVVDKAGHPLPAGEAGRLEVRMPTASEWVATADEAVLDDDGFLYVRGRLDDVIIRGGFKVPATEVESVLGAHPGISEAVVVGVADGRLGEVPVAAVVTRDGAAVTEEGLRAWARERLAPYKVPVRVVFVDALPRNKMMKVVRADLLQLIGAVDVAGRP